MPNALERLLGMTPTAPNLSSDALADLEAPQIAQEEEDSTPDHLRLQQVLDRMEMFVKPDINRWSKIYEEYGIYQANASAADAFKCTVSQPANVPIILHTLMASYDTSITSWILTLGRRVFQFNSAGSTGLLTRENLGIPLRPGDERSLKPLTGTPSIQTTLYLCGEIVRMN